MMFVIESTGISDIGKKRKTNEDALLVDDQLGLYVVADGMGGHRAGEVASKLVVETLMDFIRQDPDREDEIALDEADETLSEEANRILSGIKISNKVVYEISKSKEKYRGMGSTVSVLYLNEQTMIAANVGDSPIYLVQKGKIELLSVPHTVMAEHAAINPEGAHQLGEEYKHMLTRAMGAEEMVSADICEIPYFQDDVLIISSDGLSDCVSPDEILEMVVNSDSEKACQSLVDLANERGGYDNVTVIVLKVKNAKKEPRSMKGILTRGVKGLAKMTSKKNIQ
jgi:protein phosphatase